MAYVNPYANTMNYEPSTLWEHPEPYKTDWSTFWGKADEDEDEKDKDDGRGDETRAGDGATLNSLWGDIVKDFEIGYGKQINQAVHPTKFSNQNLADLGPLTTVPNTQQFVGDWQNPNYTGGNTQAQQVGDTQATPAEIAAFNTQQQGYMNNLAGDTTSAYSPSYATQADVYAQYPELAQNALNQATVIGDAGQLSATSGGPFTPAESLGLMDPQIAQDLMRSRTFDTTAAATRGLLEGTEMEDEDIDFEDKDWGDFW
jgi:hypothetical protein